MLLKPSTLPGLDKMNLEGDSLQVITSLQMTEADLSPIGHIVDHFRDFSFRFLSFYHVKRGGNRVAHADGEVVQLSSGLDEGYSRFSFSTFNF